MDKTPAASATTQNRLLMQRKRSSKDKLANFTIGMGAVTVVLSTEPTFLSLAAAV